MKYVFGNSCLISAHEVIGICDIDMTFEVHIWCWHIYHYSMVSKGCSLLMF